MEQSPDYLTLSKLPISYDTYADEVVREELDKRVSINDLGKKEYEIYQRFVELSSQPDKKKEYYDAILEFIKYRENGEEEEYKLDMISL
jgi:hypothetical protein